MPASASERMRCQSSIRVPYVGHGFKYSSPPEPGPCKANPAARRPPPPRIRTCKRRRTMPLFQTIVVFVCVACFPDADLLSLAFRSRFRALCQLARTNTLSAMRRGAASRRECIGGKMSRSVHFWCLIGDHVCFSALRLGV